MTNNLLKPQSITFHLRNGCIRCEAYLPAQARGLVILTHGTGTYRLNRYIQSLTRKLYDGQVALLMADLLTMEEISDHRCRMNTDLVSQRMMMLIGYLRELPLFQDLSICLMGLGTGADGVLSTAARMPGQLKGVAAINGLQVKLDILKKIFPPSIPTLILYQETLGHIESIKEESNKWLAASFPYNIRLKKIYKSDESIPWEAMEEAADWLIQSMLQKSENEIKNRPLPYEMDIHT